ncbi:MAG: (d)CMP kinase [Clostridiales Family XIII bacterium]|nr:(d)CMP kinase [Clostridiales Family XIII bacterium]
MSARDSRIEKLRALPPFVVAVDGPSGAGKSTAAKLAAETLGIDYIDTGAMYRAIGLKFLRQGISSAESASPGLQDVLDKTEIDLDGGRILLDGEDVSGLIRTPEVTMAASKYSALPLVREKLVAMQREMGTRKSVVMDGRDIGTNVFPDARFKFFITASPETRAGRRHAELREKGMDESFEDVLADILKRDRDDTERELNPLIQAEDAILLETDQLGIAEVLDLILCEMEKKSLDISGEME